MAIDAQQMSTSLATSSFRQGGLAIEVAPVERILYWGERIVLAQFSCPPMHPHFCGTGPLKKPVFGFPRKSSNFAVNDASPFLADPTVAVLLSTGDHYRRSKISVDGDQSDIIGIDEALLASVLDAVEPAALDQMGCARFPRTHSAVDAVAYRDVRILIERLSRGYTLSELEVEECVLAALASVLRNRARPSPPERFSARRRSVQLVRDVKAYLLNNIEKSCGLQELASVLHVSPFYLARTFRRETGTTLHKYLLQLKLRSSLDLLPAQDRNITRIALMLGFSSHSHFSDAFRRTFGKSPTSFCNATQKAFD
jgi:AraC family transcriptional regulator